MKNKQRKRKNSKFGYLMRFTLRSFLIAVLCLLLAFGFVVLVYMGDLFINNKSTMKMPLFSTYIIVSPSMVPTIKINDAIIVKRVDNDKYKVGDIITFLGKDGRYSGMTITHRIVGKQNLSKNESVYTTKGDNNNSIDPVSVTTDSIYGKVLFKIPKVGYIGNFFSKPINYFLCLLIPSMIFILYDVGRIFNVMNKRRKFI